MLGLGQSLSRSGFSGLANNYSLAFDGTDDHVDCGNGSSLQSAVMSIGAWFYPTANSDSIITKGIQSRGSAGYREIDIYGNGTLIIFYCSNGSSGIVSVSGVYPTLNNWHHVVATWDGTTDANGAKLYIDGLLLSQGTATNTNLATYQNFNIGGVYQYLFSGKIDEVAFWNSALSAGSILTLYNGGLPTDLLLDSNSGSLQGWWRMGDGTERGSGNTIYDMSSNSNNGTFTDTDESGIQYSTSVPI